MLAFDGITRLQFSQRRNFLKKKKKNYREMEFSAVLNRYKDRTACQKDMLKSRLNFHQEENIMNLIEASIQNMRQFARENGGGNCIDKHWKAVLPEIEEVITVEILLTLYRRHINEPMERWAQEIAWTLQHRDISSLDDATLVVHATARWMWLLSAQDPRFQAFVDNYAQGLIHPPDSIGWAKSSRLWLPISEGTYIQMHRVLISHYRHSLFAQQCWDEVKRRHSTGSNIEKHTFVLLSDSEELRQQRNEGIQWLREESRKIAQDVGEDAMQDWLEKLAALPLHMQIKVVGATRKAIRDRASDIRSKGGQYEHVSFDAEEEIVNSIADESAEALVEELINKEFLQLLSANQPTIEKLLHCNEKIAKRQFKVLQMLTHDANLTSTEIARQLKASKQTIGRDILSIRKNGHLIRKALNSS